MEIIWKWSKLLIALSFVGFCKGFPLNLEDNTGNTQFLTGIAAVLITVGIVILAGCLCCQRHNGFQEFQNSAVAVSVASNLEHGHVNSITNGEFTIFTPLNPSHLDNNLFHSNIQISARTPEEIDGINIKKWFDNTKEDFPRVKLKYIRELGSGRFGKVVEGAARDLDLDPNRVWTPVVVRILDAASTMQERVLFLNDALFYLAPSHPHILALKGQCLSTVPLLLLQELCTGGDLKARLRSRGDENNSLLWCCQLTSALRHLHDNGFIHPDLAARNCLLTDNLTLKLGDYGLSASKYPGDYYKGGEPLIPVRWRAPESLECTSTTIKPKPLTKEANIWSLGVVMWEICENGSQPYGFLDDDEVISRVFSLEGLRLDGPSKPQLYSDYIFRLIKMCWNTAESRPKITQIDMMLSDLLQVHKHSLEPLVNSDFDRRWESFKPNTIVKTDNYNEESILKSTSLSLNNLHGSLDNLMSDQLSAGQLDFKLGPSGSMSNKKSSSPADDSLNDSFIFKQQGSSGSDTEEENWRKKVERGAYSEKVRIKSRSVADLMVLTHVDYPESDTETPMQSMDFKPNRGLRKSNLENSSLNFNSEGNLLSLEDTFEQELTKLRVDRRDSALFVPENKSETNSNLNLLQELNSPLELKAMNPIYTIFNMTIDNFNEAKLHDIIALGDEDKLFSRQDSENKSDLGYATLHNSERNSDFGSVDGEHLLEDGIGFIKLEIEEKLKNCELLNKDDYPEFSDKTFVMNENLPDVLPSSVCNPERMNLDLLESNSLKRHGESSFPKTVPKLSDLVLNNYKLMHLVKDIPSESHQVPDHLPCENLETSVNLLNEKNEDTTQDILPLMSTLTESDARQTFAETIKFLDEERRNCENYLEISTKSELLPDPLNERISLVDNDQSTSVENSPKVAFDLSENQQEIKPNSLTHNAVFTSTPFGKIQKVPMCIRPSLNLFPNDQQDYEERNMFSSNFFPLEPNGDDPDEENRLNYSLETWDNFLKNSFDINNREPHENFFDSFSSDPQSMLFVEDDMDKITNSQDELNHSVCGETFVKNEEPNKDGTFVLEKCNKTFNLEDRKNGTFKVEEHDNEEGHFEPSGGWFLHPQSNNDQLTGDIDPQPSTSTGSYIKFGVDDELMTALRNELLEKLPQAQSACQENVQESETWNPIERNEVFLRYNVYNPPLSPIPEESSCLEEDELIVKTNKSPRSNDSDTDWSDRDNFEYPLVLSSQSNDSPDRQPNISNTPSQDSCCSNDTLFNFDDFVVANEKDDVGNCEESFENVRKNSSNQTTLSEHETGLDLDVFLNEEREHTSFCSFQPSSTKIVAPLPSPEDKPWRTLTASLLSKNKDCNIANHKDHISIASAILESILDAVTGIDAKENIYENHPNHEIYENLKESGDHNYDHFCSDDDFLNETIDYVNIDNVTDQSDSLGVLTDIRFSGPIDSQLMSTSFSESNDVEDQDWDSGSDTRSSSSGEFIWKEGEHEESLKALKAAPQDPLDNVRPMEEIVEETDSDLSTSDDEGDNLEFVPSAWDKFATPAKSALRSPEKSLERSESKKSKGVWFKKQKYHCVYEYPREPESPVLQSKDLWKPQLDFVNFSDWEFDGESYLPPPTAESDLNPSTFTYKPKLNNSRRSLYYLTSPSDFPGEDSSESTKINEPFATSLSDQGPSPNSNSSQFFPGASPAWMDNITPDSGLEDSTPGSDSTDSTEKQNDAPHEVVSLRKLAAYAINKNKEANLGSANTLGGLRHTRNKLKLDLPPSPSAFTSSKSFTVEPMQEPVVLREKPTFSTFGKSRFLVQHVDTPPEDKSNVQSKNVCFDVLPYKPLNMFPLKKNDQCQDSDVTYEPLKSDFSEISHFTNKKDGFTRGEANLLDSADEDSGIESSTLERKTSVKEM